MPGLKAAGFGVISAIAVAILAGVTAKCPGLVEALPSIILAGVLAGVGKFLHSERPKG